MVLYLTEGALNESVSGNEVIKAIDGRYGVLIRYSGEDNWHTGVRYIEPYVYGLTKAGNPAIRAYQYYGDTKKGVPKWKLFRLDRVDSWQPTDTRFDVEPQARGWAAEAFHGNDMLMSEIFDVVDLGEEPVTDLERLRARTRQLKQGKPVNMKDITSVNQQRKTGPVGDNTPSTGAESPEPASQSVRTSSPVNTDGTQKQDVEQPPVKQEPKASGPITGDATNPDEVKADELMSNDEFMKMLRRNLERTEKEKNKAGLKKDQ